MLLSPGERGEVAVRVPTLQLRALDPTRLRVHMDLGKETVRVLARSERDVFLDPCHSPTSEHT